MRTCATPGCTESLEGRPIHTLYCPACRAIRDKEASQRAGVADRERKRTKPVKVCETEGCDTTIGGRDHFCPICRPIVEAAAIERKKVAKRQKNAARKAMLPPQEKRVRVKPVRLTSDEKWRTEMARMGCVQLTPDQISRVVARGEITPVHLISPWHYADGSLSFQ